jgi:hypothetical protein
MCRNFIRKKMNSLNKKFIQIKKLDLINSKFYFKILKKKYNL